MSEILKSKKLRYANLSPAGICQMLAMALAALACMVHVMMFVTGNVTPIMAEEYADNPSRIILYMSVVGINAVSMICGITYLLNMYGRNSVTYLRVFMVAFILSISTSTIGCVICPGLWPAVFLRVPEIALVFVLMLVANIGRENTWIVWLSLFLSELSFNFSMVGPRGHIIVTIAFFVISLLQVATIAWAVYEEYGSPFPKTMPEEMADDKVKEGQEEAEDEQGEANTEAVGNEEYAAD